MERMDYTEIAGRIGLPLKRQELDRIIYKYPWFMTARILANAGRQASDAALALHLMTHPTPLPMLAEVSGNDFGKAPTPPPATAQADEIIEKFLLSGASRITPDDHTPDYDAAESSSMLDVSDELMTEELAEIYLRQGLTREAEEIYGKLNEK